MVLKSQLRETVNEVLEEHEIEDSDLVDDLIDRLQGVVEVMDDDEEDDEEEELVDEKTLGILGNDED